MNDRIQRIMTRLLLFNPANVSESWRAQQVKHQCADLHTACVCEKANRFLLNLNQSIINKTHKILIIYFSYYWTFNPMKKQKNNKMNQTFRNLLIIKKCLFEIETRITRIAPFNSAALNISTSRSKRGTYSNLYENLWISASWNSFGSIYLNFRSCFSHFASFFLFIEFPVFKIILDFSINFLMLSIGISNASGCMKFHCVCHVKIWFQRRNCFDFIRIQFIRMCGTKCSV